MFPRPCSSLVDYAIDALDTAIHVFDIVRVSDIYLLPRDLIDRLPCRVFGGPCGSSAAEPHRSIAGDNRAHLVCIRDVARYSVREAANYVVARDMAELLTAIAREYPLEKYYAVQSAVLSGNAHMVYCLGRENHIDDETINGIIADGVLLKSSDGYRVGLELGKFFVDKKYSLFMTDLSTRTCSMSFAAGLRHSFDVKFTNDH